MTSINIPPEALAIASDSARAQGQDLDAWIATAISRRAAEQTPVDELPVDDCGFPVYTTVGCGVG